MDFDVNKILSIMVEFVKGFADKGYYCCHTTQRTFHPNLAEYSFNQQYSSIDEGPGDTLEPGNVIDVIMLKDGNTYFASIFFGSVIKKIEYKIYRLAEPFPEPYRDHYYESKLYVSSNDTLIDEGQLDFGEDYDAMGRNITGWLQHQIVSDQE
ncbi:MAG: hypothetical protein AAGI37_12585 [Planctomycetota bacterium]